MKTLVFVLVLANLLFLAYSEGYFGRPENPDATRVEQQINPESIRIVAHGEPPAARSAEDKPAPEMVAVKEAPAPEACLTWNGLSVKDADRLAALVGEKFSDFKLARHAVPTEGGSWWVFIPPLANKGDADKKAAELKHMGVDDYFVVQDSGPNRFAISLGVFSSETGAGDRLAALKAKGVRSAKLGPRAGKDALHVIEVRGLAARQVALQEAVAAVLPESRSQACK